MTELSARPTPEGARDRCPTCYAPAVLPKDHALTCPVGIVATQASALARLREELRNANAELENRHAAYKGLTDALDREASGAALLREARPYVKHLVTCSMHTRGECDCGVDEWVARLDAQLGPTK